MTSLPAACQPGQPQAMRPASYCPLSTTPVIWGAPNVAPAGTSTVCVCPGSSVAVAASDEPFRVYGSETVTWCTQNAGIAPVSAIDTSTCTFGGPVICDGAPRSTLI